MNLRRLGAAIALSLMSTSALGQSTDTPELLPGESVVRVEADGFVERTPDLLAIGVTIRSEGPTPGAAAEANSAKLTRLVRDLNALGVSEAWISAEELAAQSIYEETDGREDRSRIVGYRARQTISIELRDLARLQPIITRLVQDGYGDLRADFRLSDPKTAEAEAQRAAITNARAEAQNMASSLGKRVGRLLLIGNGPEAYRGWTGYGQNIVVTGSRVQPLVLKPAPVRVESKVYVDWSLVDR